MSGRKLRWAVVTIAGLALAGCTAAQMGMETTAMKPAAGPSGGKAVPSTELASVPDIPVPEGTRMDVNRTLLFGGDPWYGQLTLLSSYPPHVLFDFYRKHLPAYGWRELTSVRAPVSVLTFDKEDRVLGLQISSGGALSPTKTILTVSPRGGGRIPMQPSPEPMPAPAPIQSQPLTQPSG